MDHVENTKDDAITHRTALIVFMAFPTVYWITKFLALLLPAPPEWLWIPLTACGFTSFILAYFVAGRSSDTDLTARHRRLLRIGCFFALTPVAGLLIPS
jgi:hypothetical protein